MATGPRCLFLLLTQCVFDSFVESNNRILEHNRSFFPQNFPKNLFYILCFSFAWELCGPPPFFSALYYPLKTWDDLKPQAFAILLKLLFTRILTSYRYMYLPSFYFSHYIFNAQYWIIRPFSRGWRFVYIDLGIFSNKKLHFIHVHSVKIILLGIIEISVKFLFSFQYNQLLLFEDNSGALSKYIWISACKFSSNALKVVYT